MKRTIAPLLAILLCLAGCQPWFDVSLSQSAATIRKLTKDNTRTITWSKDEGSGATSVAFHPTVSTSGFDYDNGWISFRESGRVQLAAVSYVVKSRTYEMYGWQSFDLQDPDSHAPPYLTWSAKGGYTYLFTLAFDAASPKESNAYSLFTYDPSTKSSSSVSNTLYNWVGSSLGFYGTFLGASVTADSNTAFDDAHLLFRDETTSQYLELAFEVMGPSPAAPTTLHGSTPYDLSFLPSNLKRCMYYYDENLTADAQRLPRRSFASWYDSSEGKWVTYAWWQGSSIKSKKLPISYRIDALLSNGELLSTQGETGRLYDRDGKLLATFPMGGLTYIGEQYVDGEARTYFAQCLTYDDKLNFNVYRIATAKVKKLGE